MRKSAHVSGWDLGRLETHPQAIKNDFYRIMPKIDVFHVYPYRLYFDFLGTTDCFKIVGQSLLHALQEVYLVVDLWVWAEHVPSSNALPTGAVSVSILAASSTRVLVWRCIGIKSLGLMLGHSRCDCCLPQVGHIKHNP